jgi:hypothetical protein
MNVMINTATIKISRNTTMDRWLTRKEKTRAKSKRILGTVLLLAFLLTLPLFVTNYAQISAGIDRVSDAITQIVKVTAFVLDAIFA